MSKFVKLTIAVLGLLLLLAGTMYFRRVPIEQDLTAQVKAALNRPEFSNVSVLFDGRKGILSGSVASQDLKEKAGELAQKYWGVRTIDNQIEIPVEVSAQAPADEFAVLKGYQLGDKFLLTGNVPDDLTRTRLIQQAEEVFGSGNVADQLSVRSGIKMPAGFDDDYTYFLGVNRSKAIGFAAEKGTFILKDTVPDELAKFGQTEKMSTELAAVQDKIGVQTPSAESSPKATPNADLQQQLDELFRLSVIEFNTASAALTEPSKKILDQAAELLNRFPESKVEIQGHTDSIGRADANMRLSDARALAVYQYLIAKGVATERLLAKGYGDRQPIADNSTQQGRQRNRRVVFEVQ
jgi:OOP family OmpA-OmpF porin